MRLDPEREHHESKAPAHMTRLLDNLSEHQMEKISFLRVEKWRCRDEASDEEVFRLGDQLIDILGGTTVELAHAAVKGRSQQKGEPTKNTCGYRHFYSTTHSRDECFSNPKNAEKPEVKKYLARKKAANYRRGYGQKW